MSRHRLVRNLDLDEEMAQDEEEETEQEQPMTTEQAQQMTISLHLARQLLSDLSPPIKDEIIKDSLWYYYFDVDKTVGYLRKQREKGSSGSSDRPEFDMEVRRARYALSVIPLGGSHSSMASPSRNLRGIDQPGKPVGDRPLPTNQMSAKSARNETTSGSASISPPAPPMSSMQKLLASRRAKAAETSASSAPAGNPSASTSTFNTVSSSTTDLSEATSNASPSSEADTPPPKGLSKLALLTAQRKAAAAASGISSSSSISNGKSNAGAGGGSTIAGVETGASDGSIQREAQPKPISKLSAKIAANRRAARMAGGGIFSSSSPMDTSEKIGAGQEKDEKGQGMDMDMETEGQEMSTSALMTFTSGLSKDLPSESISSNESLAGPTSSFFNLLTKRPIIVHALPTNLTVKPDTPSSATVSASGNGPKLDLNPFDQPSPDDLVLAARGKTRLAGVGEGTGAGEGGAGEVGQGPAKRVKAG